MNHAEVKNQLADYLEGELPLDARARVDAHLDSCEECAREVTEMQQTIRLLRMLPEPEQPPMVAANVMRRIRAGETELSFLERIARTLGGILEPSFVLPASAIAAAALVVMLVQEPGSLFESSSTGLFSDDDRGDPGRRFGVEPTAASLPNPLGTATRAAADSRAAVSSRVAREGPRSFGAPAAQQFLNTPRRAATTGRPVSVAEARPAPLAASDSASRMPSGAPSNIARELAEAGDRSRVVEFDASGLPRGSFFNGLQDQAWSPRRGESYAKSLSRQRIADDRGRSGAARAVPVAQPSAIGIGGVPIPSSSSGGEDPRDAWLAHGLDDPLAFARYIGGQRLAEQELWVSRLSQRAEARGLLDDLVKALRETGDETAAWVADDFAAQID